MWYALWKASNLEPELQDLTEECRMEGTILTWHTYAAAANSER